MRSYSPAFAQILEVLASTRQYTIGDFLMEFFDSPGRDRCATERSLRHGRMLAMFIGGGTVVGVGDVLQEFHHAAEEFCSEGQDSPWRLDYPYHLVKSGYAALTSYAAQKVGDHLQQEQKAATGPDAGLHVFKPRKPGERDVKLRLAWDTYGATTLSDIQAVLEKHQPLTFSYIVRLTHPERHNEEKGEFRYRPPAVVHETTVTKPSRLN
jgi:hypothetical protein